MCSIHFANAYNPPLFSLQRSFTFTHTTNGVKTNIDQTSSEDSITEDRKTSLFGYTMVTRSNIKNQQIVIISAPGRKPAGKTYGGDLFKCTIKASQISCQTLLNDSARTKIGIETEHVPFLFGATMIRSSLNYVLVCQTHRGQDLGRFKNCQCFADTRDEYVSEDLCMNIRYHIDAPIPFLNMFQIKVVRSRKWVIWGSRHFPGEVDIPPKNGEEATKLAVHSGIASWNKDMSSRKFSCSFISIDYFLMWQKIHGI
ncbi:hypothetical protein RF11_03060 [Thelohanellus kitauei]|uniref:Uncharacterized protein n=1 Tax=Thelohanellus kitauei TaxID=669202 RepID=A0A0C2ITU4_THEKT|nr:hypothetical protein RF11_03060 [Thelohanellus kitauei]